MALNRLETVGTARWNKPTARPDHGGNPTAIKADQRDHQRTDKPIEGIGAAGR